MLKLLAVVVCCSLCFARDGLELGLPSKCDVTQHEGFSLCYNEEHEQAVWVAYVLTKQEVQARSAKRDKMKWQEDPLVKTGSAQPYDYKNSGYDKGHLVPAADMRWNKD